MFRPTESAGGFARRPFRPAVRESSTRWRCRASRGSDAPLSGARVSPVATAGRPMIIEARQMQIQRTLPGSGRHRCVRRGSPAVPLSVMANLAHDLLDRYAALRQSQDGPIGLLAAQTALILDALGGCYQRGIDRGCTDDVANPAHRFADGVKESSAGVLHQMPAVGDLHRVRQGLGCRFAGDDRDRWMSSPPGLCGLRSRSGSKVTTRCVAIVAVVAAIRSPSVRRGCKSAYNGSGEEPASESRLCGEIDD